MSIQLVQNAETVASRRRMMFDIRNADGTPNNAQGGTQPQISINHAAFVGLTHIGTLVLIGNGRYYADVVTGDLTAGAFITGRWQAGSLAEHRSLHDFMVVNYDPYDIPSGVDSKLSTSHGSGDWSSDAKITGTAPGAAILPINSPLSEYSGSTFQQTFQVLGGAFTPGTFADVEFSIKRNKESDDDKAALILARKHSGGAGTDGLYILNGVVVDATAQAKASLAVTAITGGIQVVVTINGDVFTLPPDEDNPYTYELKWWGVAAGSIEIMAQGDFTVLRPVIRSVTA
jgi:hypothetical protein